MKLLTTHFRRFGLTVHTGSISKKESSKTEFVHIPAPDHITSLEDTERIFIEEDKLISSCEEFQYLGSKITSSLECDTDIDNRIKKAQFLFYMLNKSVFRRRDLDMDTRCRVYVATIINILLWGCESWPLTKKNRQKLDVFHNRCCRRFLNISIFDVIADHSLTNKFIYTETGIKPLSTYVELRRVRWLEKIANMRECRNPRKLLGAWIRNPRRNEKSGRPQQTIRHAYIETLRTIGFSNDFTFEKWMTEAKNRKNWAKRVEYYLSLPEGTYCRTNGNSRAAELKTFENL